jgi:hypothetical protein
MAMLNQNDLSALIPELKSWNGGKGVDIETWISCEGDHKHLIGYAQILWPDFVEHDGCIFLGGSIDEDNYRAWLAQTKGDKKRVEAVINIGTSSTFFRGRSMILLLKKWFFISEG